MSKLNPSTDPRAVAARERRARRKVTAPPSDRIAAQPAAPSRSLPMNGMSGWVTPALTREEYMRRQAAAKPPAPRVRASATLEHQSVRRVGGPDFSDTVRY